MTSVRNLIGNPCILYLFICLHLFRALIVRKKMSETDKIEGIGDILVEQVKRKNPFFVDD